MKTPFDVPGFIAGYRFQNDPRYYDSATGRFIDLAGYGLHCEKTAGTIAFSSHGSKSREGILLDNSCQFRIENPNPWEITFLAVMKAHFETGNAIIRPLLFGDATSSASNGQLTLNANAAATSFTSNCATPSGALAAGTASHTEDAIFLRAFAFDQETRKAYSTVDAVTVSESSAAASSVNGNAVALGWNGNIGIVGAETNRYIRVGNNSGTIGDTAANATNYAHLFALFFFARNQLTESLSAFKAFLDTEKLYYGIT